MLFWAVSALFDLAESVVLRIFSPLETGTQAGSVEMAIVRICVALMIRRHWHRCHVLSFDTSHQETNMFDQLKNLGSMMQQAQQLQGKMKEAKEKAAELRVEGSAGGDMVKVQASGDLKITAISIDLCWKEMIKKCLKIWSCQPQIKHCRRPKMWLRNRCQILRVE